MINEMYPPQHQNPARELYKFWYHIVQHSAPAFLTPKGDDPYRTPAAFVFSDGHGLHVDRDLPFINGKPSLHVPGVMRIWPNGHFTVHQQAWSERAYLYALKLLERHTFLRWGYVAYGKALWVQDTPRRGYGSYGNGAVNREHPDEKDYNRRVPYLPLTPATLFEPGVQYRLVQRNSRWIIASRDPAAQGILDERYGIAEKRYNRWETRAERAAVREGKTPRPVTATSNTAMFTRSLVSTMKVWEPQVGPGGVPYTPQDPLPMKEEEVLHSGPENRLAASPLG